uniref:Uncharacterized protein n=1 Tax=Arundo donax TaxID=35708 RepID=A0A0A9GFW0_ARUDO
MAARTSLRFSLPSTSIIARPCASVLAPSSSLPPSRIAFPEVPATLNKRSPRSSTELCRIRQLSLKIPSSIAGSNRGKDDVA